MKARMVDNLVDAYQNCSEFSYSDGTNELELCDDKDYEYRVNFLNSISGKEVDLVFCGKDAFEKNDNNLWLPDSLWEAV